MQRNRRLRIDTTASTPTRRVFRTALLAKSRSGRRSTPFGACLAFLRLIDKRSPYPLVNGRQRPPIDGNAVLRSQCSIAGDPSECELRQAFNHEVGLDFSHGICPTRLDTHFSMLLLREPASGTE